MRDVPGVEQAGALHVCEIQTLCYNKGQRDRAMVLPTRGISNMEKSTSNGGSTPFLRRNMMKSIARTSFGAVPSWRILGKELLSLPPACKLQLCDGSVGWAESLGQDTDLKTNRGRERQCERASKKWLQQLSPQLEAMEALIVSRAGQKKLQK